MLILDRLSPKKPTRELKIRPWRPMDKHAARSRELALQVQKLSDLDERKKRLLVNKCLAKIAAVAGLGGMETEVTTEFPAEIAERAANELKALGYQTRLEAETRTLESVHWTGLAGRLQISWGEAPEEP